MKPTSLPLRNIPRHRDRGAVLIVALLLAGVVALSLASYLALSKNALKLANRSFYNSAAINLSETGVEEAMWSFNQATSGVPLATAWVDWDRSDGVTAKRTFTNFSMSGNATTAVKVYVDKFNPPTGVQPIIVAQTTVTIPNEARSLGKTIEVTLRRRSKFAMGMVAKDTITFRGNNASVDSWNSDPDNNPATAVIPYSAAVKHDSGSVGSTSVAVGSLAVNNADIWGFASVGTTSSSGLSVGSNGTVAAFGQPQGTIDTTRVATDFTANFDPSSNPTTGTTITSVGSTLGVAGTANTYRFNGEINSSLTVLGDVTLILTAGATSSAIRLTGGSDSITIPVGSTLTIYTAGEVTIAGNGVLNQNTAPKAFQLWGTSTSATAQNIAVRGNGFLSGIVYAPNASVTINGNGDVLGSVVANQITLTGNAAFHYDESLANFGSDNPYGVFKWRELNSAADHATYATQLASF